MLLWGDGQPLEEMLYEFMEGTAAIDSTGNLLGSGDVKYHLVSPLLLDPPLVIRIS